MFERLKSDDSEVVDLLLTQALVERELDRATFLQTNGVLEHFSPGNDLITLGDTATDVYFLLTGKVRISIGKRVIVESYAAGNHIGELAALQVTNRSTTVTALDDVVALKITKSIFKQFLRDFPTAASALAQELAKRLVIRNANIAKPNPKHRIFAISSAEALKVALGGTAYFLHDNQFEYAPWPSADVFQISSYPLDDLEDELERADFAIAIAQADDIVHSRDQQAMVPRDNVLFELGLFMGRLGRKRTILMVPKGKNVKLPSDLGGLTIIYYPSEMTKPQELAIWEQIKGHFRTLIQ